MEENKEFFKGDDLFYNYKEMLWGYDAFLKNYHHELIYCENLNQDSLKRLAQEFANGSCLELSIENIVHRAKQEIESLTVGTNSNAPRLIKKVCKELDRINEQIEIIKTYKAFPAFLWKAMLPFYSFHGWFKEDILQENNLEKLKKIVGFLEENNPSDELLCLPYFKDNATANKFKFKNDWYKYIAKSLGKPTIWMSIKTYHSRYSHSELGSNKLN